MTLFTNGPMLEADRTIDQMTASLPEMLGATAAEAWADSPVNQILGISELNAARGDHGPIAYDPLGNAIPSQPEAAADAADLVAPRIDMLDANDRVKKAGLAGRLKLPDQPDIGENELTIMMERARQRAERETTIERGPGGVIPSVLSVGTSFLVGAADPINLATAFIPVMGELRYGKLLADAGESALARAAVRGYVGAAQGAVGQAVLEPLDWYAHTQEGRDFGMANVLENILFGAALGGGLHAGGGFISDAYRRRSGRELYPFGPGEPMERGTAAAERTAEVGSPLRDAESVGAVEPQRVPIEPAKIEREPFAAQEPAERTGEIRAAVVADVTSDAPPSPEVMTINDLPRRAHEDATRTAIANLLDGTPVQSGDLLEAAARTDSRIAESFDLPAGKSEPSRLEGVTPEHRIESHPQTRALVENSLGMERLKPGEFTREMDVERNRLVEDLRRSLNVARHDEVMSRIESGDVAGAVSLSDRVGKFGRLVNLIQRDLPAGESGRGIIDAAPENPAEIRRQIAETLADLEQSRDGAPTVATGLNATLDQDAAFKSLSSRVPEFDEPAAVAASQEADKVKVPPTRLDERVAAAERADADAKGMFDMFSSRLPEEERAAVEQRIAELDLNKTDLAEVSKRAAVCMFGPV